MSEPILGMSMSAVQDEPREAAAVVLVRRRPSGAELLWIRRAAALDYAGGFHALPGGTVGVDDQVGAAALGLAEAGRFVVAAARELFEEVGLLVAQGTKPNAEDVRAMRSALSEKRTTFAELLLDRGLRLVPERWRDAGRWLTPPFMPTRFDARFLMVEVDDPTLEPLVDAGEVAEAAWIRPELALAQWEAGQALLHPPLLHVLETLRRPLPTGAWEEALRSPPRREGFVATLIEFQKGIRLFPLRTPTLPPATHTNAYVVGSGELLVIDPGASDEGELLRLERFLGALEADGLVAKAVVLTHHHVDHVGGLARLRARGLPLWCHAITGERLGVRPDRLLREGDRLELRGSPSLTFEVFHTPGHAPGHLCLVETRSRAAVVGDMVAGVGTILVDPPEGNMIDYLAQLARLAALPVGTLYPAHGPAIAAGPERLQMYLEHRRMREGLVLAAVSSAGSTLEHIVAKAYAEVLPFAAAVAERSTLAVLEKLRVEGRVRVEEGRYYTP